MEDNRALLEVHQMEQKNKFERKFELRDLARQYRRERIQWDSKGENLLKEFYDKEIKLIEVELGELADAPTGDNRKSN